MVMSAAHATTALSQLPVAAASAVKKEGWRGMMRALSVQGKLLITNHNAPEAVILSTSEYSRLVAAASAVRQSPSDPLAQLRQDFDQRLASLQQPDAGARLRALMDEPGALDGQVKAGATY